MTCLTTLEFTLVPAAVALLWAVCALVLALVARRNRFAGKPAFIVTFAAMLWWLFTVVFALASQGLACKVGWSLAAWPGITLLPIAWAFFVFDYTMNTKRAYRPFRRYAYFGLPAIAALIAFTNGHTHQLYGTGTHLVDDGTKSFVVFEQGPLFYAIAASLYPFVASALGVLAYAFLKAEKNIRPFLGLLMIISIVPLAANMAYVGWGFMIFGFDPTPFMFALALIAFSWLLINNLMMDTAALGRSLLFYATQDPVIIIDAVGQFAGANSAAYSLFNGKKPKPGESLDHVDTIGPILRALAATGDLNSTEPIRIGERVYEPRALPIASPIQTTGNLLGWSVTLFDITERERTAEALRQALDQAEAANQAKSEFLAVISHELRTPMTSVRGGLDLTLNGAIGEVSDPVKDLLGIVHRNAVRLQKLIEDILQLQKLDLSAVSFDLQNIDPDKFLRETIEAYEGSADNRVDISMVSHEVVEHMRADPVRLSQVIGKVLSNAIKFSPDGAQVECSASIAGPNVRLSIRDNGIGIPENAEDRVFGRFTQVDGSSTRSSDGTGLGLHIAKLLIEHMGGSISYESQLGAGTTFHIDIPVGSVSAQANGFKGSGEPPRGDCIGAS
jgi:signal transduction histidine kinase